ncbi:pentapeptide repeat-containing protein [Streptomyces sp. URMC 125]
MRPKPYSPGPPRTARMDLRDAHLIGADLGDADLDGADLDGAKR